MEIEDEVVGVGLDQPADPVALLGGDLGIEQRPARGTQQPVGPPEDDSRADQAHHRIEPDPAEAAAADQRHDCQHRSQGVGQHVEIGGPQIVILV
jgi:hypothetical protein